MVTVSTPANPIVAVKPRRADSVTSKIIPLLYEDEQEEDRLPEGNLHARGVEIIHNGVTTHIREIVPRAQTYTNMALYYSTPEQLAAGSRAPCVAPDFMAVEPFQPLPYELQSYTIGRDGPAPFLTMEFLSDSTFRQNDLTKKPDVFAALGVREYIIVDPTGTRLPEKLLLKRLQPDGSWKDERDADGGVTSILGFRIIVDSDGLLRVVHAATGHKYLRPDEGEAEGKARREAEALAQAQAERARAEAARAQAEAARAQAEAEARNMAEHRVRELEAEVKRLRVTSGAKKKRKKKPE